MFLEKYGIHVQLDRPPGLLHIVSRHRHWSLHNICIDSVGTLSFGLGLPGLIIGIYTFVNMTWNCFVVFYHPTYFRALKEKADRELHEAVIGEAAKHQVAEAKNADVEAAMGKVAPDPKHWDEEHKVGEAGAAFGAQAPKNNGAWQMRTDEHSGAPYWVNTVTGEQSWDNPMQ